MPDNIPDIPDESDGTTIRHDLPREVTSWKLAGLMASDGRAFLRCSFEQEVGGAPDPGVAGGYVGSELRTFTVHWEMGSLKEFVRHLFVAATEIERRAGGLVPEALDLAPMLAGVGAGTAAASHDPYRAGYL